MNIDIKISFYQLTYLNDCFAEMGVPINESRDSKVSYNILQNLHKKLLKKTISKIGTNGKFKLSLEFYEAHFLEKYLIHSLSMIFKQSHAYISIQTIVNELNQKLS